MNKAGIVKAVSDLLLIDDSEEDNEFHTIVIKLIAPRVKIHTITDSREALTCWKSGLVVTKNKSYPFPGIVFLDINMPAINGLELLEKMKAVPDSKGHFERTSIYLLSSYISPVVSELAAEKYGDLLCGFYEKPLTGQIFLDALDKHAKRQEAPSRLYLP